VLGCVFYNLITSNPKGYAMILFVLGGPRLGRVKSSNIGLRAKNGF